jgi:hypothetical protein
MVLRLDLAYAIDANGKRMRLYVSADADVRGPGPGSALK